MSEEKRKKACAQFLQAAQLGDESQFMPRENLTPYALYNSSEINKRIILEALSRVNPSTFLILLLGESNQIIHGSKGTDLTEKILAPAHDIFGQDFVKGFAGKLSILIIDPTLQMKGTEPIEEYPIDPRLVEKNVVSIQLVKAKFPLSPVYGPHKKISLNVLQTAENKKLGNGGYSKFLALHQPNAFHKQIQSLTNKKIRFRGLPEGLRRIVHTNTLDVLNGFVSYPSPLFISSRITSLCYRSFKYLIDIRATFGRQTWVRYEYTEPRGPIQECVSAEEYALFPNPFEKCETSLEDKNLNSHLEIYYTNMLNKNFYKKRVNATKRNSIRNSIRAMNAWANEEIRKHIPSGGKRKTRRRV